jgi:hypothetical protein
LVILADSTQLFFAHCTHFSGFDPHSKPGFHFVNKKTKIIMDTGTIIVSIVFIALCTLPFIFIGRGRRIREKAQYNSLVDFANRQGGNITAHEFIGDTILGLDEAGMSAFFAKSNPQPEDYIHLKLSEITHCKVNTVSHSTKTREGQTTVIEKIELSFFPALKQQPVTSLEVYNTEQSSFLSNELLLSESWATRINTLIRQKRDGKKQGK